MKEAVEAANDVMNKSNALPNPSKSEDDIAWLPTPEESTRIRLASVNSFLKLVKTQARPLNAVM
jgi:hypothetical protein